MKVELRVPLNCDYKIHGVASKEFEFPIPPSNDMRVFVPEFGIFETTLTLNLETGKVVLYSKEVFTHNPWMHERKVKDVLGFGWSYEQLFPEQKESA